MASAASPAPNGLIGANSVMWDGPSTLLWL